MVIAIDFDGTIVAHEYPKIGRAIPNALRVLKRLQSEAGHKIILYTMRSGRYLKEAVEYCVERDIRFWGVNENPEQKEWTNSPKAYANLYIDDAALGCPLKKQPNGRACVDWAEVERILEGRWILGKVPKKEGDHA